jgi:stage III sporulation protein AG
MQEKIKLWIQKKDVKKWLRKENLIVLILTGVLLLVIAWPSGNTSRDGAGSDNSLLLPGVNNTNEVSGVNGLATSAGGLASADDGFQSTVRMEDYQENLEKQLEEILSAMDGVGLVKVMITMQSSEELIVEKNIESQVSTTKESDSAGGQRQLYQKDTKEEPLLSESGDQSIPYVVMTNTPRVEGVLIVAQGAGQSSIKAQMIEAAAILFDLGAHKIKVLKMADDP